MASILSHAMAGTERQLPSIPREITPELEAKFEAQSKLAEAEIIEKAKLKRTRKAAAKLCGSK